MQNTANLWIRVAVCLFTCNCAVYYVYCFFHRHTRHCDRTLYLHIHFIHTKLLLTFVLLTKMIIIFGYSNIYFANGKLVLIVSVIFAISFSFFFWSIPFIFIHLLVFRILQIFGKLNCQTNWTSKLYTMDIFWNLKSEIWNIYIFSIQNFREIQHIFRLWFCMI